MSFKTSAEIDNNIYDELGKELRVEISDVSTNKPLNTIQTDNHGRTKINTIFGEGLNAGVNWEFNANFAYQGDTRKLQASTLNGGNIIVANSLLVVSSGTNSNGYAYASSKRALRYRAGQEGIAGFTFMFPNRVVGNDRYVGLIDYDNGFSVGVRGLEFGIFYKKGGVLTFIPQSTFNIDKIDGTGESEFTINTEKLNICRITYAYFGIAPPTFEIYVFGKGFVPFHSMDFINNSTSPHITLPYIKFGAYNVNTTNTTNVSLYSASLAVGVIGSNDRDISTRNFTYALPNTPDFSIAPVGGLQTVVVLHNKPTYGGVANKVENLLNLLSATVLGANKQVTLKRYHLATPPTGGTWTDVSPNSIFRYSLNTAINLTGAELTLPIELGTSDKFFETTKIVELDLRAQPNDYVAYVLETKATNGTFRFSIGWKELF